ncbi:MAG: hypothetical protein AB7U20_01775 [Planctomycetaceae bacterium]
MLRALRLLDSDVRVCDFRKIHMAQIERTMTGKYSPTTIKDTLAAVHVVFSWAVKQELIEPVDNLVVGYQKHAVAIASLSRLSFKRCCGTAMRISAVCCWLCG